MSIASICNLSFVPASLQMQYTQQYTVIQQNNELLGHTALLIMEKVYYNLLVCV